MSMRPATDDDVWNTMHAVIEGGRQRAALIAGLRELADDDRDTMIEDLADMRAAAIFITTTCLDAGEQEVVKLRMTDRLSRWGMRPATEDDRPVPAA